MSRGAPLPTIVGQLFLAGSGFLGYRCDCGYAVTGRTLEAVDAGVMEHQRYRHEDHALPDDGVES